MVRRPRELDDPDRRPARSAPGGPVVALSRTSARRLFDEISVEAKRRARPISRTVEDPVTCRHPVKVHGRCVVCRLAIDD